MSDLKAGEMVEIHGIAEVLNARYATNGVTYHMVKLGDSVFMIAETFLRHVGTTEHFKLGPAGAEHHDQHHPDCRQCTPTPAIPKEQQS